MFTVIETARIRAESLCAEKTIRKYPNCRESSRKRIEDACARLGITIPAKLSQATVGEGA